MVASNSAFSSGTSAHTLEIQQRATIAAAGKLPYLTELNTTSLKSDLRTFYDGKTDAAQISLVRAKNLLRAVKNVAAAAGTPMTLAVLQKLWSLLGAEIVSCHRQTRAYCYRSQ